MSQQNKTRFLYAVCLLMSSCISVGGDEFRLDFDAPGGVRFIDRWVYPFNITPGSRINASTFGAVGSEGFDDRDGQFLIGIDTVSLGIEPNLPPSSYQIESAVLTVTDSVGGYRFDRTYDSYRTYLDSGNENYVADDDRGRPIELFGAGFRNGYEEFGWPDGGTATEAPVFSAGSPFGVSDRSTRNVFAADSEGNDVSNNVDSLNGGIDGFDPSPFAIAQILAGSESISEGSEVPSGATLQFEVDLSNAGVLDYFQTSLANGQLGLVLSSLHGTGVMGAGDAFPNPATSNHFASSGPKFEINVDIVSATIQGDFNGDGELSLVDIDLLTSEARATTHRPEFDLTNDGQVDDADRRNWVEELFPTYFGDSNLDGEFGTGDLIAVFGSGEYEDGVPLNSTWATGDWNGDGEFDTNDLVLVFQRGGFEQGPRVAAMGVPEPSSCVLLLLIVFGFICKATR